MYFVCLILLTPVGKRGLWSSPASPVLATGIRFTGCGVSIFLGSHISCNWTPVVEPFADLICEHCWWWRSLTFLRVLLRCQSSLSVIVCVSRSVVSNSGTPWTVTHQAPLSMGFLQARILEWVAIPFSRGSSQPRDQTRVSRFAGRFFTIWAIREADPVELCTSWQLSVTHI